MSTGPKPLFRPQKICRYIITVMRFSPIINISGTQYDQEPSSDEFLVSFIRLNIGTRCIYILSLTNKNTKWSFEFIKFLKLYDCFYKIEDGSQDINNRANKYLDTYMSHIPQENLAQDKKVLKAQISFLNERDSEFKNQANLIRNHALYLLIILATISPILITALKDHLNLTTLPIFLLVCQFYNIINHILMLYEIIAPQTSAYPSSGDISIKYSIYKCIIKTNYVMSCGKSRASYEFHRMIISLFKKSIYYLACSFGTLCLIVILILLKWDALALLTSDTNLYMTETLVLNN
ncbi:MAG: hypothetical protein AAF621_02600 [Pseudomonadota bacterium]